MSSMPNEQQIAEAIEKILRRSEFGGANTYYMPDETMNSLARAFFSLTKALNGFGWLLLLLLAVALISLVVWLVYSNRRYRQKNRNQQSAPGRALSDDPLLYAQALAARQDWSGAIIALYTLHLRMLHQQGWIIWDKSKTGLQYLWELKRRAYEDIEGFDAFRKVFNRLRYGGYEEPKETYDIFLAYCQNGLKRGRAA